jgi:hypothetical protein
MGSDMKKTYMTIILRLLAAFLFIIAGLFSCEEYDEENECYHIPAGCVTVPYTEGTLTIHVSTGGTITATILEIYRGDVDTGVLIETINNPGATVSRTLDADNDYAAKAIYTIGSDTITAIDGDSISGDSEDYCEGTCYEVDDGEIDVRFDEDAFKDYRAGKEDKCFIATAAYGSPFSDEVQLLRDFRDRFLLASGPGRLFVRAYYRLSPPVASFISGRPVLRFVTRCALAPLVAVIACPVALPLAAACAGVLLLYFRRRRNAD